MALYHTYRPVSFDDTRETQPKVTSYFESLLVQQKLGHIYLLVGSHGIGKTSTARILARAVNCEHKVKVKSSKSVQIPCNVCANCKAILEGGFADVYELDAASNRGVDDVRALQEIIKLSPVVGDKKVYIIDEVHMLTSEAFNALLKTFEEPPAKRLFLLCTTELHKVPMTIQSRAQIVQFEKPTEQILSVYIERIVQGEQAKIDPEASLMIARAAEGAFRDAAKLVEQLLVKSKDLNIQIVDEVLGYRGSYAKKLLKLVEEKSLISVQSLMTEIEQQRLQVSLLIKECIMLVRERLHTQAMNRLSVSGDLRLLRTLQQALVDTKATPLPTLALELALLELMLPVEQVEVPAQRAVSSEQPVKPTIKAPIIKPEEVTMPAADRALELEPIAEAHNTNVEIVPLEDSTEQVVVEEIVDPPDFVQIKERWREVVLLVKGSNASVASVLRLSPPKELNGKELLLSTTYRFHKDRIESTKNRQLVESALYELFGLPLKISCHLVSQSGVRKKDVENVATVADEGLVEAALEIFAS